MLKIHQIFIIKFLILFVGSLLVTSIISYVALKNSIIEHNKDHLKSAINMIEYEIQNIVNMDKYVNIVRKETKLRITIIDSDGVVIAESNANKEKMDNHASRYEVMQSNKDDFGYITRYSKTLKVDFLYVAKKIDYNNKSIYIRLSMSLAQIMNDFYSLWTKLFFVFAAIVFIATFISRSMSKRVEHDIVQITSYLDEISNKNYKAIIKTEYFYEFLQISLLLKNLVKKLSKNEKKKIKNIAKLRLINKQRNDILSALSHEFKNPVAAIIGYAQTIQEDEDMPQKVRDKFLSKIDTNAQKISQMIDRLALSVKLDNDDLNISKSKFRLDELCKEISTNLGSKYKDREIVLELSELKVNTDKTMLELVLTNLIDNALKYSHNDVKVIMTNDKVMIKDTGIGIKDSELDKVTAKFYRVDKNSWDNSMGLGLSMVTYVLKLMDSSLEIDSTFGVGSEFSFSHKEMKA